MEINNVSNSVITTLLGKKNQVLDDTKVSSTGMVVEKDTGKSSLVDILDLNSSSSDSYSFLNYNSNGKYSNLVDFLNSDEDDLTSLLETDESNSLIEIADNIDDDNSITSSFAVIAQEKTDEIDNLINKALNKLSGKK